jgi:hypothetical protein
MRRWACIVWLVAPGSSSKLVAFCSERDVLGERTALLQPLLLMISCNIQVSIVVTCVQRRGSRDPTWVLEGSHQT